MLARENPLGGTVEIDEFFLGGRPKKKPDEPPPGRGRKGLRRTTKQPVLAVVQRPGTTAPGAPAGDARAAVVANFSMDEVERVLEKEVDPRAHLMSDEWKGILCGRSEFCRARDRSAWAPRICSWPGSRQLRRGLQSAGAAHGSWGLHHISPEHADLYFHEIGFRWSQRIAEGEVIRRKGHGREKTRTLWSRVPPALQLRQVFRAAVGREMRRTRIGGITIKSPVTVFG